MADPQSTTEFLLAQCRRYPEDLLKFLHQSVFGCGHFVTDKTAGLQLIQKELAALPPENCGGNLEALDGGFCRLHLRYLRENGLSPQTLFSLFALAAASPAGNAAALEEKLACLLALAREGRLPFPYGEAAQAVQAWRNAGFPACHHSEEFRRAYAPAYRLIIPVTRRKGIQP